MAFRAYVVSLILALACAGVIGAHAQTTDALRSAIDQKTRELDEVTKKIQETQINLTEEAVRGKTLKQEVSRIDTTVQKVNLNIKVSELTIDKLRLEIDQVQREIAAKEESAGLRRETISRLLQAYQQRDRENVLIGLLQGKSLAEGVAEAQQINDLNDGLLREVDELRSLKAELSDRLNDVAGKKKSVENERETLKARKAIAEDQLTERQRLLAETKNREENYKKLISDLEKQQEAISDQIGDIEDALRTQYGSTTLPTKRPGVFAKPVAEGATSQGYGRTPYACKLYPRTCFHNGIDYGISVGTPILAAEDGIIQMAGNNGKVQYGKYILIKHNNGLSTLYGHLSRQEVANGQLVKRGEVIGYSGRTGYAKGAHLHFMVYLSSTVQLKSVSGAGLVPIGFTLNPFDYL